ncbi:MAG: hypothetical protein M5T61_10395 [Acidimicrobiia bacterium]|nr:hypothetical protein [Acidimicrobiia bacterium]
MSYRRGRLDVLGLTLHMNLGHVIRQVDAVDLDVRLLEDQDRHRLLASFSVVGGLAAVAALVTRRRARRGLETTSSTPIPTSRVSWASWSSARNSSPGL